MHFYIFFHLYLHIIEFLNLYIILSEFCGIYLAFFFVHFSDFVVLVLGVAYLMTFLIWIHVTFPLLIIRQASLARASHGGRMFRLIGVQSLLVFCSCDLRVFSHFFTIFRLL